MIETISGPRTAFTLERTYTADTTLSAAASHTDNDQRALTSREICAVIARNDYAALTYTLDDGSKRSRRARYAYADNALIIAATECPTPRCYEPRDLLVECDVSELDGLSHWHYVWIGGAVTHWQPTGSAAEREVWRDGVERLRRILPELARTEELAFANFGVVRIEIVTRVGLALRMT